MIFQILTLIFITIFFGVAFYVSFAEQPARLACEPSIALAQWRPSYKRAAAMQILVTIAGVVCAVIACIVNNDFIVLLSGLTLATVAPFTLIVIMPVNKQLLDPVRNHETPGTLILLKKWGRLHFVR